jgi:hypothetical protein
MEVNRKGASQKTAKDETLGVRRTPRASSDASTSGSATGLPSMFHWNGGTNDTFTVRVSKDNVENYLIREEPPRLDK